MKVFGYVNFESTQRYENGRIILGYKKTDYDGRGNIVEVKSGNTMSVGYNDKPMSKKEALSFMRMESK